MRAMQITELGQPLRLADLPLPAPGPGEVLVRVAACGINFADTLMAAGRYQEKPALPFCPGLEVAGTVDAVGPAASPRRRHARCRLPAAAGGLAEFVAVAAEGRCTPFPDTLPDEIAAAFPIAYGTSHVALAWLARLRPCETLVVTGAAGGVGLTAVEIGALLGARVIAVARGPEKRAVAAAAGAAHTLDASEDLRAALRALGGVDVVYDTVGGAGFDAALRATRPGGRLLPIGFAGGKVPQIPANLLLVKNLTAIGFYFGAYRRAATGRGAGELHQPFRVACRRPASASRQPRAAARSRRTRRLTCFARGRPRGKVVVRL